MRVRPTTKLLTPWTPPRYPRGHLSYAHMVGFLVLLDLALLLSLRFT